MIVLEGVQFMRYLLNSLKLKNFACVIKFYAKNFNQGFGGGCAKMPKVSKGKVMKVA